MPFIFGLSSMSINQQPGQHDDPLTLWELLHWMHCLVHTCIGYMILRMGNVVKSWLNVGTKMMVGCSNFQTNEKSNIDGVQNGYGCKSNCSLCFIQLCCFWTEFSVVIDFVAFTTKRSDIHEHMNEILIKSESKLGLQPFLPTVWDSITERMIHQERWEVWNTWHN